MLQKIQTGSRNLGAPKNFCFLGRGENKREPKLGLKSKAKPKPSLSFDEGASLEFFFVSLLLTHSKAFKGKREWVLMFV